MKAKYVGELPVHVAVLEHALVEPGDVVEFPDGTALGAEWEPQETKTTRKAAGPKGDDES